MTRPARIPADIHRPDRIVGPFTARQAAMLTAVAVALYLGWILLRHMVPWPVLLLGALPIAGLTVAVALGQRDGLPMDRLLLAALRHRLSRPARTPGTRPSPALARRRGTDGAPGVDGVPEWIAAHTSPGDQPPAARTGRPAGFPARTITAAGRGRVGVVDLGADGLVVIAALSTVNLTLRTPAEQDGLLAVFARYLHSLGGPVQILIRALPLDLTAHLHQLHAQARELAHPALAAAAMGHLNHLARLAHTPHHHDPHHHDPDEAGGTQELLTRQVLLILREPGSQPDRRRGTSAGAEHRLLRRLHDAAALLAPLEVTVHPLDAAQATNLLVSTCNPDHRFRTPAEQPGDVVHRSGRSHRAAGPPPTTPPAPPAPTGRRNAHAAAHQLLTDDRSEHDHLLSDDDIERDNLTEAYLDDDRRYLDHHGNPLDGHEDGVACEGETEGWGPDPWVESSAVSSGRSWHQPRRPTRRGSVR